MEKRTAELFEKEALLRQKQKLEAIGSLAGGIAHEFNNLLQVIRGYTEFAMDEITADNPPYRDLVQVIKATKQAATIIDQLLHFGQRRSIEKSQQKVNDIVGSVQTLLRPVLGTNIDLELHLNDQEDIVCADCDLISQALLNLCINARDAMPSGGRLQISTEQIELADRRGKTVLKEQPNLKPGVYSVITVTDSGCGISPEVLDLIFDPFFSTKDIGEGSGMGLTMVIGAVQEHGGTVTVESSEGLGIILQNISSH